MKPFFVVGLVLLAFTAELSSGQDSDTIPLGRSTYGAGRDPQASSNAISDNSKGAAPGTGKSTADGQPYVASVDTFGSDRINSTILKQTLGEDLNHWLAMGLKGDSKSTNVEEELASRVRKKFGFARADFSVVQYFMPGDLAIHITLDVVERKDVARRMPFYPDPTGIYQDPDGLIAAWQKYENIGLDLVTTGEIEPEADRCVAFHCPFGHKNAKLKKYEKIFLEGVRKNFNALVQIQESDKRPDWRAAATYLLPYWKDGNKVVSLMVNRIKDPDPMVRNNALRVLGDIAEFHPDILIPLKPVIAALQYPRTSDRTKSIYVVYLSAMNSAESRHEILKEAFPSLMDLLASEQPDSRDITHALLRKLSGKDFAASDLGAWQHWYSHLGRERLPSTTR